MAETQNLLISIVGRDKVGVVSEVTGYLFDIGGNLADSSYAVLGEGFEFSAVTSFQNHIDQTEIEEGLSTLATLQGARITVVPFDFETARGETATITHTVEITGGDRPGLIARMSEVLMNFDANIVRMSSKRTVNAEGVAIYRTRFAVSVAAGQVDRLSAALYNTAGSLRLDCTLDPV